MMMGGDEGMEEEEGKLRKLEDSFHLAEGSEEEHEKEVEEEDFETGREELVEREEGALLGKDGGGPSKIRWAVLVCTAYALMGWVLSYDSIGALTVSLQEDRGLNGYQIGLMYSMYGVPGLVWLPLAGLIVDRIGTTRSLAVFGLVTTLGTATVALEPLWLMLAGRGLVGLGGETIALAARKATGLWFPREEERALALSVVITLPWTGSILAFLCLPSIARHIGASGCLWLTAGIMASGGAVFLGLQAFEQFGLIQPHSSSRPMSTITTTAPREEDDQQHVVKWEDVKRFPPSFWLLASWQCCVNGTLWPFLAMSSEFYHDKFDYSAEQAGFLGAAFAAIAIASSPLFGSVTGRYANQIGLGIAASAIVAFSYLLLGFTDVSPIYGTVLLSLTLGMSIPVFFSSIPLIVDPKATGTALGISATIANLSFVSMPFAFGYFYHITSSFHLSLGFFSALGLVGILIMLVIKFRYPLIRFDNPNLDPSSSL